MDAKQLFYLNVETSTRGRGVFWGAVNFTQRVELHSLSFLKDFNSDSICDDNGATFELIHLSTSFDVIRRHSTSFDVIRLYQVRSEIAFSITAGFTWAASVSERSSTSSIKGNTASEQFASSVRCTDIRLRLACSTSSAWKWKGSLNDWSGKTRCVHVMGLTGNSVSMIIYGVKNWRPISTSRVVRSGWGGGGGVGRLSMY